MQDLIILVCYLNVDNIQHHDIKSYMDETDRSLRVKGVKHYLIPTWNEPSRIECINPKLVSEDDYKKAKDALDEMHARMDGLLEKMKNMGGVGEL